MFLGLELVHHCACWWPSTIRCWAISRHSDDYKVKLILLEFRQLSWFVIISWWPNDVLQNGRSNLKASLRIVGLLRGMQNGLHVWQTCSGKWCNSFKYHQINLQVSYCGLRITRGNPYSSPVMTAMTSPTAYININHKSNMALSVKNIFTVEENIHAGLLSRWKTCSHLDIVNSRSLRGTSRPYLPNILHKAQTTGVWRLNPPERPFQNVGVVCEDPCTLSWSDILT